jgi:predicted acetyltransferase
MDRPDGAVTATEILIEALENIDQRGISKVLVFCYDYNGFPVGWLSNVGGFVERLGLVEMGKQAMIELPAEEEDEDELDTTQDS